MNKDDEDILKAQVEETQGALKKLRVRVAELENETEIQLCIDCRYCYVRRRVNNFEVIEETTIGTRAAHDYDYICLPDSLNTVTGEWRIYKSKEGEEWRDTESCIKRRQSHPDFNEFHPRCKMFTRKLIGRGET